MLPYHVLRFRLSLLFIIIVVILSVTTCNRQQLPDSAASNSSAEVSKPLPGPMPYDSLAMMATDTAVVATGYINKIPTATSLPVSHPGQLNSLPADSTRPSVFTIQAAQQKSGRPELVVNHKSNTYKTGNAVYDLPDSLLVNETYKAFLTLSSTLNKKQVQQLVNTQMLRLKLSDKTRFRNDTVVQLPVAGEVSASLTCISGNASDLSIVRLTSDQRTLDTADFTTHNWQWNIKPLKAGRYELALRICIGRSGQASLNEVVLDQTVFVRALKRPPVKKIVDATADFFTSLNAFWEQWNKGVTGSILLLLVGYFRKHITNFVAGWKRKKGKDEPEEIEKADVT